MLRREASTLEWTATRLSRCWEETTVWRPCHFPLFYIWRRQRLGWHNHSRRLVSSPHIKMKILFTLSFFRVFLLDFLLILLPPFLPSSLPSFLALSLFPSFPPSLATKLFPPLHLYPESHRIRTKANHDIKPDCSILHVTFSAGYRQHPAPIHSHRRQWIGRNVHK